MSLSVRFSEYLHGASRADALITVREAALAFVAEYPVHIAYRAVNFWFHPTECKWILTVYNCPRNQKLGELEQDFYVYQGRVYEPGDALCTRCCHQLACTLNNGPIPRASFDAAFIP